jgi:hypothetical protein
LPILQNPNGQYLTQQASSLKDKIKERTTVKLQPLNLDLFSQMSPLYQSIMQNHGGGITTSKLYKAYRNKDKIAFIGGVSGLHRRSSNSLEEISEQEREGPQVPNSFQNKHIRGGGGVGSLNHSDERYSHRDSPMDENTISD